MNRALVAALVLFAVPAVAAEDITVVAKDNFFEVDGVRDGELVFAPGETYTVTLVNEGNVPHDLQFDFDGDGTSDAAVTMPDGSLLPGGETQSATFTVPASAFGGHYWCSAHGSSSGSGMAGVASVEKADEGAPGLSLLAVLGAVGVALLRRR